MKHEDKLGRKRGFVPHTANANHRLLPGRCHCEPRCFRANPVSRCLDRGQSASGTDSQRQAVAYGDARLITLVPSRRAWPHRADIDGNHCCATAEHTLADAAGRGGRCRLWQRRPILRWSGVPWCGNGASCAEFAWRKSSSTQRKPRQIEIGRMRHATKNPVRASYSLFLGVITKSGV